jgi:hypothetical protein
MMESAIKMIARAAAATGNSTAAPPQAGILEGANPTHYTPSNPITLFIIQVCVTLRPACLVPHRTGEPKNDG